MKRSISMLLAGVLLGVSCAGTDLDSPQPQPAEVTEPITTPEVPEAPISVANETLETIRRRLDSPLGDADRVIALEALAADTWLLRDGTLLDVSAGVPWGGGEGATTSQLRLLHSLLLVHDLVATDVPQDLDTAFELVEDWAASNPRQSPAHHMAWHDETTARRTTALIRLHDGYVRAEASAEIDPGGDRRGQLESLISSHLELLLDDEFHATGTNHGMFQDRAALLASAYLAHRSGSTSETDRAWSIASARLVEYYQSAISDEGVHLEHAPAYHQLIAASARADGEFLTALDDPAAGAVLAAAHADMVRYATHVVQPDGTWPLVSDTFSDQTPRLSLWDEPEYRYAASAGDQGHPPDDLAVAFEDAGYVIMRDRWTDDGLATYLHFTAAYHTDYHKHADDLSVWLYHDGPLLTELGPNGYSMDDPLVQCAYSDDAHNIATVDGLDLPRTDDRIGATRITTSDLTGDRWTATGINERIDGVAFERDIAYEPAAGIVEVVDRIQNDRPRAGRLRWHLDPTVTATPGGTDHELLLTRSGHEPVTVQFSSDAAIEVDILEADADDCVGLRFGGGEPTATTALEIRTEIGRSIELTSRFELP